MQNLKFKKRIFILLCSTLLIASCGNNKFYELPKNEEEKQLKEENYLYISLSSENLNLNIGDYASISVNSDMTTEGMVYGISNENVAYIKDDKVYAKAIGECYVIARNVLGIESKKKITISANPIIANKVTGIEVECGNLSMVGDRATFSVSFSTDTGLYPTIDGYHIFSSDEDVISVNGHRLQAKSNGEASIKIVSFDGGYSKTIKYRIGNVETGPYLDYENTSSLGKVNSEVILPTPSIARIDGIEAKDKIIYYDETDPNAIIDNEKGTIISSVIGVHTIKAKLNKDNISACKTLHVTMANLSTYSPNKDELLAGFTFDMYNNIPTLSSGEEIVDTLSSGILSDTGIYPSLLKISSLKDTSNYAFNIVSKETINQLFKSGYDKIKINLTLASDDLKDSYLTLNGNDDLIIYDFNNNDTLGTLTSASVSKNDNIYHLEIIINLDAKYLSGISFNLNNNGSTIYLGSTSIKFYQTEIATFDDEDLSQGINIDHLSYVSAFTNREGDNMSSLVALSTLSEKVQETMTKGYFTSALMKIEPNYDHYISVLDASNLTPFNTLYIDMDIYMEKTENNNIYLIFCDYKYRQIGEPIVSASIKEGNIGQLSGNVTIPDGAEYINLYSPGEATCYLGNIKIRTYEPYSVTSPDIDELKEGINYDFINNSIATLNNDYAKPLYNYSLEARKYASNTNKVHESVLPLSAIGDHILASEITSENLFSQDNITVDTQSIIDIYFYRPSSTAIAFIWMSDDRTSNLTIATMYANGSLVLNNEHANVYIENLQHNFYHVHLAFSCFNENNLNGGFNIYLISPASSAVLIGEIDILNIY